MENVYVCVFVGMCVFVCRCDSTSMCIQVCHDFVARPKPSEEKATCYYFFMFDTSKAGSIYDGVLVMVSSVIVRSEWIYFLRFCTSSQDEFSGCLRTLSKYTFGHWEVKKEKAIAYLVAIILTPTFQRLCNMTFAPLWFAHFGCSSERGLV